MEERDKRARLSSLTELKRLRTEGGSRIESLKQEEERRGDAYYKDLIEDADEDESGIEEDCEFIEQDHPAKRPAIFTFNNRLKTGVAKERALDPSSIQDDYFKSILSTMDKELESEGDSEGDGEGNAIDVDDASLEPTDAPTMAKVVAVPPPVPLTDGNPLSSEWAPADERFEIDETLLNEQMAAVHWSDDLIDDDFLMDDLEEARGIEEFIKENNPPSNQTVLLMNTGQNASTTPTIEPVEIEAAPSMTANPTVQPVPQSGQVVNFYWLDAYEKPNGTIFLFGKIGQPDGSYLSCCVAVHNMKRNVFFLPRETLLGSEDQEVTLKDVYEEIASIAATHRIGKFGCKKVERRYAFEIPGIPVEADYIKMVYPFSETALSKDLVGNSFSHVFGTGASALELFLIKRKVMGPCWLQFRPKSTGKRNMSWCKVEMEVDDPKSINPILNGPEPPTLTVLSLSLRTLLHVESKTHEIVAASGLVYNSVHVDGSTASTDRPRCNAVFSVARESENLGFTQQFTKTVSKAYGPGRLELAKNERALLGYLIAMIYRSDPDVIVGHNFLGFDLGVLLHRMRACKVDFWSRLGRLNWSHWPKAKPGSTEASYAERQIVSGRLICDTYLCAKDLVKSKNYSLQTLVETQLQQERTPLDYDRVGEYFAQPEQLAFLLRHCEKDAHFQAALMFQLMVLPLTKQLTNIAGNLWSRTMMGSRAERNEYLLLHEFHNQKYICPDKSYNQPVLPLSEAVEMGEDAGLVAAAVGPSGKGRRKPTYAGGLVLEPKKGLYDNYVLLLDFNSLYPSIIQEFNICFTTIERDYSSPEAADRMPEPPPRETSQGILPRILANLVARRKQIKAMMKDPKLSPNAMAQLHIRQQALKLTANSMYGCLGFAHSRFFARPLAMLITGKGREILQSTVDLAESVCRLEVVYGDTDSVMIHTGVRDLTEARKMGLTLKKAVNERYRLLEIELDGVFEKLLLLKKKKYAAVVIEEKADGTLKRTVEMKGLDLVRRDWCGLSVDTSNQVLERILAASTAEVAGREEVAKGIHQILCQVATAVAEGKVPLEKYVISKNLTKDPEHYHDAKSQPHVIVALQMREKGTVVRVGDTIPYVICGDTQKGGSLADHAFHPDKVLREGLEVDKAWYLAQQVHPCVARLCEHLTGTDNAQLAACLGLDASKYHTVVSHASGARGSVGGREESKLCVLMTDEERFGGAKPLELSCTSCSSSFNFKGLFGEGQALACPQCECRLTPLSIYHQLQTAIRWHVAEYYLGWMECDESTCRNRTRNLRVYESLCPVEGCRGSMHPVYPARHLYRQLLYYRHLVEGEKNRPLRPVHPEVKGLMVELEPLRGMVRTWLDKCAYPVIKLGEIFSFVTIDR